MTRTVLAIAILGLLAPLGGCDSKSAAAKFCLGADGTHQDCKICCEVDKAKECCDKAEKLKPAAEEK